MSRFFSLLPTFAALLAASLIFPDPALAWGPGAHMVAGNWILQNLSALPATVAAALMLHPADFLHGSLTPDIFIGRGSRSRAGHSHNWESGFALLALARTPRQTAHACGYLAHLAADVVAHNVFVPGLLHTVPIPGKLGHVYLEAQADRLLSWDSGDAVTVLHGRSDRKNDAALRATMRQRAFPFWIKKRLFGGSVALGGTKAWRGSMRAVDSLIPQRDRSALLERMMTLSARAIFNILREGENSPLLALDPIGAKALAGAKSSAGRPSFSKRALTPVAECRSFAAGGPDGKREPGLGISVPPVLEAFPPLCTSDGMRPA